MKVKSIGIIVKHGINAATDLACDVISWAQEKKLSVCVDNQTETILTNTERGLALHRTVSIEEIAKHCDAIVTLGGDGTLIGVARYIATENTFMVGVNFGTLGFLTEIRPEELIDILEKVLQGSIQIGKRGMLQCSVETNGNKDFYSRALNDVVLHKGTRDRLLEMDIVVDGNPLARMRADGLILSTPTGSTAYSLAAGGSIVHPELPATLLTPICAHSLTMRPLVFASGSKVQIYFPPYDGEIFVTVDGQLSHSVKWGSTVSVTEATNKVSFVRSPTRSYYDVLTAKLNWGIPNRAH